MTLRNVASASILVGANSAERPANPGKVVPFWNLATNGLSLYDGTEWQDNNPQQVFDVTSYGAIGDGSPANAAANAIAIQAAVNAIPADGGLLYFPAGYYYVSEAIVLKSYVRVLGAGPQATRVRQTDPTKNLFSATDTLFVAVEEMQLIGPSSGTGHGIHFIRVTRTTNYVTCRSLSIFGFGGDGILADEIVVSVFDNVISSTNLGNGFRILGGTSLDFIATFALNCNKAGYELNSMDYCAITGAASDLCGLGYLITNGCSNITLTGCGAESCRVIDATYNGTGVLISGSVNVVLTGCLNYDNRGIGYRIASNSAPVLLNNVREVNPAGTATASIQVDAGSKATILGQKFTTAMNLAASSTSLPDSTHFVLKTVDQIVNNSSALINDNALVAPVVANAKYLVNATVIYSSGTTPDIKFAWVGPAGATFSWTTNALSVGTTGSSGLVTVANSVIGDGGALQAGGAGVPTPRLTANIRGILTVGATAGTLQLRWAQDVADASNTTVKADSFMELRQVV